MKIKGSLASPLDFLIENSRECYKHLFKAHHHGLLQLELPSLLEPRYELCVLTD